MAPSRVPVRIANGIIPTPWTGTMVVRVAVPKESLPGERRVALVPDVAVKLVKGGWEVRVEAGAGIEAGFPGRRIHGGRCRDRPRRCEVLRRNDRAQRPTPRSIGRRGTGARDAHDLPALPIPTPRRRARPRRREGPSLRARALAPDQSFPEHGRPLLPGHRRRLRRGHRRRRTLAPAPPDVDDRGGHDPALQGPHPRSGRRRPHGDRDGPPTRRGRRRVRCPASGRRAGPQPGGEVPRALDQCRGSGWLRARAHSGREGPGASRWSPRRSRRRTS